MIKNNYNYINHLIVEKIQLLLKPFLKEYSHIFFYHVLILTVNLCLFAKK